MEETDVEEHWQLFICHYQILIVADIPEHLKQQITEIQRGHFDVERFQESKFGEHVHGVSILVDDLDLQTSILLLILASMASRVMCTILKASGGHNGM